MTICYKKDFGILTNSFSFMKNYEFWDKIGQNIYFLIKNTHFKTWMFTIQHYFTMWKYPLLYHMVTATIWTDTTTICIPINSVKIRLLQFKIWIWHPYNTLFFFSLKIVKVLINFNKYHYFKQVCVHKSCYTRCILWVITYIIYR